MTSNPTRAQTGADRARRARQRRKLGTVFVQLEINGTGLDHLCRLGWLSPEKRLDKQAVAAAVLRAASAAIVADIKA